MIRIGNGPNLEIFEIRAEQRPASGLGRLGLNHISFYCDEVNSALKRLIESGGHSLSEVH